MKLGSRTIPAVDIGPASITIRPGYGDDHSSLAVLAALDSAEIPPAAGAARRGRRAAAGGAVAPRRVGDRRPVLPDRAPRRAAEHARRRERSGASQTPELSTQLRVDPSVARPAEGCRYPRPARWTWATRSRSVSAEKRATVDESTRAVSDGEMEAVLRAHNAKTLLRFVMCGSVDDGKSTLIGRLLYESRSLFVDQLAALEADSKVAGTQGDDLDFALLLDGLAAEREQGITIDVAYRHFSTERRHFIVADTPGHEQYTRNMVTGASTADSRGDPRRRPQGRADPDTAPQPPRGAARGPATWRSRSTRWTSSTTAEERFREIEEEYRSVREPDRARSDHLHPGLGAEGRQRPRPQRRDAVVPRADADGLPRDGRDRSASSSPRPFRMPVQWVNRPNLDFRGFAGTIASGVDPTRRSDRDRAVGHADAASSGS